MSSSNDLSVFKKASNSEITTSATFKQKSFGDTVNNLNEELTQNCIDDQLT